MRKPPNRNPPAPRRLGKEDFKPDIEYRPLTAQEKMFVAAYEGGDPYPAVVAAGYEGSVTAKVRQGERLLSSPSIRRAIRAKSTYEPNILDEIDIKEHLTRIIYDPDARNMDRLKALELYGKTMGMYVDRQQMESVSLEMLITEAAKTDEDGDEGSG